MQDDHFPGSPNDWLRHAKLGIGSNWVDFIRWYKEGKKWKI
jgi:hypothetical protein